MQMSVHNISSANRRCGPRSRGCVYCGSYEETPQRRMAALRRARPVSNQLQAIFPIMHLLDASGCRARRTTFWHYSGVIWRGIWRRLGNQIRWRRVEDAEPRGSWHHCYLGVPSALQTSECKSIQHKHFLWHKWASAQS
jgi:hypothetical protein